MLMCVMVFVCLNVCDVELQELCVVMYCVGNGYFVVVVFVVLFVFVWNVIDVYLMLCFGVYVWLGVCGVMGLLCCCLLECFWYEDKVWVGDVVFGVDCEFRGCDWARVDDLSAGSEDKLMVLYQGIIEFWDCVQGQFGDCWLVSVLVCLVEYLGVIKWLILNGEKSFRGKYRVRFYDGKEKRWVIVMVDDFIFCYKGMKNLIFM